MIELKNVTKEEVEFILKDIREYVAKQTDETSIDLMNACDKVMTNIHDEMSKPLFTKNGIDFMDGDAIRLIEAGVVYDGILRVDINEKDAIRSLCIKLVGGGKREIKPYYALINKNKEPAVIINDISYYIGDNVICKRLSLDNKPVHGTIDMDANGNIYVICEGLYQSENIKYKLADGIFAKDKSIEKVL